VPDSNWLLEGLTWVSGKWLELGTLVVSGVALRVSQRAQNAVERGSRASIKFHLVCRSFSESERRTDVDVIATNLSAQANTFVKTRVALMDGPPRLLSVHVRDRAGVAVPFEALRPGMLKQLLQEGAAIETTPIEPDRRIRSLGARAPINEFTPPIALAPMASETRRVSFEVPEGLPEFAFDSLRVWVQARDVHGNLWEEMLPLAEGVVESCHI
jgi:hypothetical protein